MAVAEPVRLAIIGCGDHAYETLAPQLRWAPDNRLVAIADPRQDRLDRFSRFFRVDREYRDYRDLLADGGIDGVIVSVGHDEHPVIAEDAMRAGCQVFVEKSPCANAQQARHVAQVQEETGRWTMVGWQRRFMPAFTMAQEITRRPEFGRIHMFQSQINAGPYRDEDFYLVNHVVHHLDLARYFMGTIEIAQVQRVTFNTNMFGCTISFRSAAGGIGTIQSGAFLDQSIPTERTEILGNNRNIVVESFRHMRYNRPSNGQRSDGSPAGLVDSGDSLSWDQRHRFDPRTTYRGFEDEIHYFVSRVADGQMPSPDIADSIETMRLLDDVTERLKAA